MANNGPTTPWLSATHNLKSETAKLIYNYPPTQGRSKAHPPKANLRERSKCPTHHESKKGESARAKEEKKKELEEWLSYT